MQEEILFAPTTAFQFPFQGSTVLVEIDLSDWASKLTLYILLISVLSSESDLLFKTQNGCYLNPAFRRL